MYSWFKQSPARKQDLIDVIDDFNCIMEKSMLYFTNTRWVLLGKVITRILTLWEPLHECFLTFLPDNQKVQIRNNERYDRIKLTLTSYVIKIRLHFILFLCETIFDRFLTLFQQEAPLIHLLHYELSSLYRMILLKFLAHDYVGDKAGGDLLDIDFKLNEKQLNNKHIRIGEGSRKVLTHLTQKERDTFFEDVKKIYHATTEYFKKNLPLKNSFLRDVQILHPSFKSTQYSDELERIARAVPGLLTDREIDCLQGDSGSECITYHRIDYYWNTILGITTADGRPKYPTLGKLIKNILIIPHGKADIERGFSINENMVPQNRSLLSDTSINGLRSTYDGVKFTGNGSSHKALYESRTEILKEEEELLIKQSDLQRELNQTTSIITDGSKRLQLALKNKNSLDIDRATILIDGGDTKSKTIIEQLSKITEELIKIQKKRKDTFGQQQQKRQKTTTDSSININ
ncbi:unnamed protein product [Rotaria sp. Silwood2]|nr:unnamed protein product [Rotaria sp. Silwood2]